MNYEEALKTIRTLRPNLTDEQCKGNAPYRIEDQESPNHVFAYYLSPFGRGYTRDGKLVFGDFIVDRYNTIYICENTLRIVHNPGEVGKYWCWSSIRGGEFTVTSEKAIQSIGPHKLQSIVDKAPEDSKLWTLFHDQAKSLFDKAKFKGDYRF